MRARHCVNNQQGFTLIEIIAVLVLLGILAAVAVPKYMDLTASAKNKAVDAGIAELNSRESLAWGNIKLTGAGWASDALTFAAVDTNLGADYTWSVGPAVGGGTLVFQLATAGVPLTRTASTVTAPGTWKRT